MSIVEDRSSSCVMSIGVRCTLFSVVFVLLLMVLVGLFDFFPGVPINQAYKENARRATNEYLLVIEVLTGCALCLSGIFIQLTRVDSLRELVRSLPGVFIISILVLEVGMSLLVGIFVFSHWRFYHGMYLDFRLLQDLIYRSFLKTGYAVSITMMIFPATMIALVPTKGDRLKRANLRIIGLFCFLPLR